MDDPKNIYTTLDLGEAATLKACDYKLLKVLETKKRRQLAFVFEIPEDARDATGFFHPAKVIERYRASDLPVDAYTFFLAIKEMKSRIHNIIDIQDEF